MGCDQSKNKTVAVIGAPKMAPTAKPTPKPVTAQPTE
jgi:hypothetical protein